MFRHCYRQYIVNTKIGQIALEEFEVEVQEPC